MLDSQNIWCKAEIKEYNGFFCSSVIEIEHPEPYHVYYIVDRKMIDEFFSLEGSKATAAIGIFLTLDEVTDPIVKETDDWKIFTQVLLSYQEIKLLT